MADINQLLQRRNEVQARITEVRRDLRNLQDRERALVAAAQAEAATEQGNSRFAQDIERTRLAILNRQTSLDNLTRDLDAINREINQAQQGGQVSTGITVGEAQTANDDRADSITPDPPAEIINAQGRIQRALPFTVPSNTAPTAAPPTTGTDPAARIAAQIQAIPPPTARTPVPPGSSSLAITLPADVGEVPGVTTFSGATPSVQRGVAAAGDDNTNGTVARINDIFGGTAARVTPQSNVLDRFSNYTYTFSLYLTTNDEYRGIANGQRPSLSGRNLLIQSGGAATGQRNQAFPLDFYIDDVSIRSMVSGKGTQGAHNAVSFTFRIYEPNGITLLDRLAQAVKQLVRNPNQTAQLDNYAAQPYLMVIRFWGYDENGELVRVNNAVTTPGASQEPGLIVEKYIPFRFTAIKFRVANRITEYNCECVALRDYAPMSQTRGIIPYNIELTAVSLQQLLGVNLSFGTANQQRDTQGRETTAAAGTPVRPVQGGTAPTQGGFNTGVTFENQVGAEFANYFDDNGGAVNNLPGAASTTALSSQSSAPPKATAAPRPTLVTGLTAALNEFQAELVRKETYTYPDVYEIIINESVLREATLQPAEAAAGLRSVPMTSAQTAGAQKLGIKQSVDRDNKNVAATAGMSVVQFLDQIVRNSSYIQDQQTKIYKKNATGTLAPIPRATGGQTLAWYRIGMDAVPIRDKGIDPKRGDYSYRITYTITPYQVNTSQSAWFPGTRFNGTHKRYDYWFTGLNTSIISYEQSYDYLYYIAINGGQGVPTTTADYRDYVQYAFQARAPEASQGAEGPVFDPAAQAAGALYSPGDTAQIKMQIMGDPAWLQQGEIVSGVGGLGQVNYGPFLPDGTINYDSREVLFEVTFNTPADYDLDTGLQGVNRRSI